MSLAVRNRVSYRVGDANDDDLQGLVAALADAVATEAELHLDMSTLDAGNASQRRLDAVWLMSLANLLLGEYNYLPVHITLPRANGIQLQLQRNAVYSALGQRLGSTSYSDIDKNSSEVLTQCRKQWVPGCQSVLFQEYQQYEEAEGVELSKETHLYTNVHASVEENFFRRYDWTAAFPWLSKALEADNTTGGCFEGASRALLEVLDNFTAHPFNWLDVDFDAHWLGPGIVHGTRSGLLASITRGGKNSRDRLYFLAFDNGFCIPRTMRWQHPRALEQMSAADITERVLLERLVERGLPGHCGEGLWRLRALAEVNGGHITVITEDDQSRGRHAVRIDIEVPECGNLRRLEPVRSPLPIPWRGTTIHVKANVPKSLGEATESQQAVCASQPLAKFVGATT